MEVSIKTLYSGHLEKNGTSYYTVPSVKKRFGFTKLLVVKCAVNKFVKIVSTKQDSFSRKNCAVRAFHNSTLAYHFCLNCRVTVSSFSPMICASLFPKPFSWALRMCVIS